MRAPFFASHSLAAASAGLLALLCATAASADEPAAGAPQRPVLVLAAPQLAGTDLDDRAIAVVAAHLRPLDLELRIVRTDGAPRDLSALRAGARTLVASGPARGVIWIDAADESHLGLYALEREGDQLYGRRVNGSPGKTAAALESLAGIAAAAAEELLAGRTTGLVKIDVPVPAQAPESPAPVEPEATETMATSVNAGSADAPPGFVPRALGQPLGTVPLFHASGDMLVKKSVAYPSLAFSVGYTGGTLSRQLPWQNGASFRLSLAPFQGLHVGAGYDWIARTAAPVDQGRIEIERHPAFASGGYRFSLGSGFELQLGARATVDVSQRWLSHEPRLFGPPPGGGGGGGDGKPDRDRTIARTELSFSLIPVAEAFFVIAQRLRMNALVGVDFVLADRERLGGPSGGPPDGALGALSTDRVRFIAGLGFDLGLIVPQAPARARTAAR